MVIFLGKIILHKVFIMEALECLKRIEKESIQTIYID
ncbi:site-specific DNA-methyltransferase, partial [Helicobacter pylori]